MYGETGEPKDGNTKIAGQGHCRTENMECGKELDMQNETDKQILSTLNQDNFQNSSGGKKAAEDDEMGLFWTACVRWCRNSLVRKPQNGLWYKIKI